MTEQMLGSALIALGANATSSAGEARRTLAAALSHLDGLGMRLRAVSRFYRSPAFPPGSGPDFVNACAEVATEGDAAALLARLHETEARFGRERTVRWGPRTLDLDLLFLGGLVLPDRTTWRSWRDLPPDRQREEAPGELILPHPRIEDRAFVLLPLSEIAGGVRHPVSGRTVAEMCRALPEASKQGVVPL